MHLITLVVLTTWFQASSQDDQVSNTTPTGSPPLMGLAVAHAGTADQWEVCLAIPKVRWEVVGTLVPKTEWPRLKTSTEWDRRTLRFGGPSQLAESRIVDLQGQDVSRAEVTRRLKAETAVLVSISGEKVDPFYLRLTKPDTLIILLGPRESAPAPELLPAAAAPRAQTK